MPSHRGSAAFPQSASERHSRHAPEMQNDVSPVPVHAAPVPHRHARFAQLLARSGLHAPLVHAEQACVVVATHAGAPLPSQQSWFCVQPREPPGSHAAHSPLYVPARTHAGSPPGLSAHRRSLTAGKGDTESQAAQTLFTQNGALALVEQSLSFAQATQRPVFVSHAGVPGFPVQCAELVQG